jgi:hypothetical protein
MGEIKFDKRNYRKHDDKNKKLIKKSLEDCGTGRSILIDKEGEIIAGNGVYSEASKLKIPVKVIETDGTELIAIKRTDLATNDEKRKQLAVMDNTTSDSSSFDMELLQEDFGVEVLGDMGLDINVDFNYTVEEKPYSPKEEQSLEDIIENLPEELKDTKMIPEQFQEVVSSFKPLRERVIITYPSEKKGEMATILGLAELDRIVYTIEELQGEKGA